MIFLDERLIGAWLGTAEGVMEASGIVFLADGRGWSRFDSISGELAVSRFRWHCPDNGVLSLRYTWQVSGEWDAEAAGGDGFAVVRHSGPFDEVIETGYRVGPHQPQLSASEAAKTALLLDQAVEFEHVFHRSGRPATVADDPSTAVVPYPPAPHPGGPPRS
ncbi:hypothetical protein [Streptomyces sp. NPDC090445]|uniref:hypothetical protein n=1 Tax=Streptomyces sp. NPDC090445 TaxID=3365963 RepID=UPI003805C1E3